MPGTLRDKARNAWRLLRAKPFDISTAEGREDERHRRVLLSIGASGIAKGATLLTQLIVLPLVLGYLGEQRFGLWAAINSLSLVMVFGDLGIGNGLMNAVAEADGRGERHRIAAYVSTAVVVLSALAVIALSVYAAIASRIDWGATLNAPSDARQEAREGITAFALCFALRIPAECVLRVQMGLQLGFMASLWQIATAVLSLCATIAAVVTGAGVGTLVLATLGVPVIGLIANSIWFFGFVARDLRPSPRGFERNLVREVLGNGLLFFVLQAAGALGFMIDPLILTRALGPVAVTEYTIPARLFEFLLLFLSLGISPLWPAYAEAAARRDNEWVRRTLKRSMTACLLVLGPASLVVAACGSPLLTLWIHDSSSYSVSLFMSFAAWTLLRGLGSTYSMFLNGIGVVRVQVIIATSFATVSVVAKIILVSRFGIVGMVAGSAALYLVTVAIPYLALMPSIIRALDMGHQRR